MVVGHGEEKTLVFSLLYYLLIQSLNRKSTFAALHSDINSLSLATFIQPASLIAKRVDQQK